MADDDQFFMGTNACFVFCFFLILDADSEATDESDDDPGFFPIDDSNTHSSQSNSLTTTRNLTEHSSNRYPNNVTYSQDTNFEYVGKLKLKKNKQTKIKINPIFE